MLATLKEKARSALRSRAAALRDCLIMNMNDASAPTTELCANLLQVTEPTRMFEKAYANREDFRRVFVEHLDSFYQLCFLLTRDREKANKASSPALMTA